MNQDLKVRGKTVVPEMQCLQEEASDGQKEGQRVQYEVLLGGER